MVIENNSGCRDIIMMISYLDEDLKHDGKMDMLS